MKDEFYMKVALKEAKKAYKNEDIPVGAVLVYKDKIIAKNYNRKEKNKNVIQHAEILVIEKGCKYFNNWHLNDCILYITLEPCLMCAGAIIQSRIKKIVYAAPSPKFGYITNLDKIDKTVNNHIPIVIKGVCEQESSQLLKSFFQNKRG